MHTDRVNPLERLEQHRDYEMASDATKFEALQSQTNLFLSTQPPVRDSNRHDDTASVAAKSSTSRVTRLGSARS